MVYFIGQQANDLIVQFESAIDLEGFTLTFTSGDVEKNEVVPENGKVVVSLTAEETATVGSQKYGYLELKDSEGTVYLKFRPDIRILDENGTSVVEGGGNRLDLAVAQFPNIPPAGGGEDYVKHSDFDGIEDPAQSTRSCQNSIIQMLDAVRG